MTRLDTALCFLMVMLSACSQAKFKASEAKPSKAVLDKPADTPQGTDASQAKDAPQTVNGKSAAADADSLQSGAGSLGDDGDEDELTADKISSLCNTLEKKTLKKRLLFPARKGCHYLEKGEQEAATPGNLVRKNDYVQAREVQEEIVALPSTEALLCSVGLDSQKRQLRYDDFIILTINGYALLVSNSELLRNLEQEDGIYRWDFERVKGKAYDFEAQPYCIGDAAQCSIPRHDKSGEIKLNLDTKAVSELFVKLKESSSFTFATISTGDNDEDCMHTGLDLELTLDYVDE